jgi:preprotein translocase subunit SecG
MQILTNILIVVHIILTAVLIVVVLLQESKSQGLSNNLSGGSTDTFFGKHGSGTYEAIMRRWTAVVATLFIATSLTLTILLSV